MRRTSTNAWATANFTWASCGTTSTKRNYSRMPNSTLVLEICGEGKTDIGQTAPPGKTRPVPEPPTHGALPVLVHKLCGTPSSMRVLRRGLPYLAGKSLAQKVKFVKQTAFYNQSAGAVFVVDTEGEHPGKKRAELEKGRDAAYPDFP